MRIKISPNKLLCMTHTSRLKISCLSRDKPCVCVIPSLWKGGGGGAIRVSQHTSFTKANPNLSGSGDSRMSVVVAGDWPLTVTILIPIRTPNCQTDAEEIDLIFNFLDENSIPRGRVWNSVSTAQSWKKQHKKLWVTVVLSAKRFGRAWQRSHNYC